ncbi:Cytochrome P450, E-class, group I [Parasponia andersonii]|uniref:Cytochrome P450, E-class, group I n=1 Tax=Parasponia andersonii TaxID=3476 RepID=A0A2P5AN40_PARAD|nr:Cytochrome P450, E-class, group I [Parasponia andersonii]
MVPRPSFLASTFFLIFPLVFSVAIFLILRPKKNSRKLPRSYPLLGTYMAASANKHRRNQWFTELLQNSPSSTFVIKHLLGSHQILTGNPAVVQHILKSNFPNFGKGDAFRVNVTDFLGDGIFAVDGQAWKFQRQVASHEFNTKSLRKFVETVVDAELHGRLIPILAGAAAGNCVSGVLDFQDILQRFAFDNICKIAFGYDPAYLLPSLPESKLAVAFDAATKITGERSMSLIPLIWKIKKIFNVGSQRELAEAVAVVREFALTVIREKKKELVENSSLDSVDLLSRFLSSGHSDDKFVTDIVISFVLAGRDTTSAALTWFFWLVSTHPRVEREILSEIISSEKKSSAAEERGSVYEEVKEMVYTHAALCESMRLYPPVPSDSKHAANDDVLPDGTTVKKGERVTYHPYAMGRLEVIWGKNWAEYRPERWLKWDEAAKKWRFVARDPYSYPVFQAGPRICLGKEMAFLQMKRVVAGVMRRFRVVPAMDEGFKPVFLSYLTAKMKGGFPVKIHERNISC